MITMMMKWSSHTNVFEPVWSAVFFLQKGFSVGESAGDATSTFGRVRAVEEGDVLVANIAEPREEMASE